MLGSVRKILFLLVVGLVGPAFSVPFTFTYSGRLLDATSGNPITGTRSIKITFWTAQNGGSQLAANAQTGVTNDTYSVSLVSGVFSQTIHLSAANFHTVFPDSTTGTWVQVQDMTAGTTYPRQQFTTVPYALKVPVDGTTVTYNSSGQLQVSSIGSASLPATINATTVTAATKMGVGTTSPSSLFEVLGAGAIASSALVSSTQTVGLFSNIDGTNTRVGIAASGSAAVPVLDFRRTLGTAASPTAVTSGQNLGQMQWWGYDGTQIADGGRIMVFSTENWTSTARGTDFRLRLNPTGSTTSTEVLRVTGDGNMGIGTTTPYERLRVVDDSANFTAFLAVKYPPSNASTTNNYVGNWSEVNTVNSTGQLNALYGGVNRVVVNTAGSTVAGINGSTSDVYVTSNRPITTAVGLNSAVNHESTGTITQAFSLIGSVNRTSTGAVTNGYGLYISQVQATNKFGVYSADSTAANVLMGNTGIGTSSPAAKLDVAGEVKFGNTSSTCNATNEGQQRYNSTSKNMEFCNGTAWTAYGTSGRTSCPAGFTLIGTSGTQEAFCISTTEEVADVWGDAVTNCYNKTPRARLCNVAEWTMACFSGAATAMTGNWEWVADIAQQSTDFPNRAVRMGNGSCTNANYNDMATSYVSRCCFR